MTHGALKAASFACLCLTLIFFLSLFLSMLGFDPEEIANVIVLLFVLIACIVTISVLAAFAFDD